MSRAQQPFDSRHGLPGPPRARAGAGRPWARSPRAEHGTRCEAGFRPTGAWKGTTGSVRGAPQAAGLAGLVVVCVLVYARALWRTPQQAATLTPEPILSSANILADTETLIAQRQLETQRERATLLAWGRDPFLRGSSQATGDLTLSGILWDPTHPLAIINGVTLTIGEEVEGFQVLDIQQDRVTLTDGTQTYQLRIVP